MPAYVEPDLPAVLRRACAALGMNPLRTAVLGALRHADNSLDAPSLAAKFPNVPSRTIYKHLKALEAEGLVTPRVPPTPGAKRGRDAMLWVVNVSVLDEYLNEYLALLGYEAAERKL